MHVNNPAFSQHYLPWRKRVQNKYADIADMSASYVKYGIAVPTDDVLRFVATKVQDRPVIELGSGLGYVSSLLAAYGLNVKAVDYDPYSSTRMHLKLAQAADADADITMPELYHETIRAWAGDYVETHDHCAGAAVVIINFPDDPMSWLWRYDWKSTFKGDLIIISFSTPSKEQQFQNLVTSSGEWIEAGNVDMPKWNVATSGLTQKVRVYARRTCNIKSP